MLRDTETGVWKVREQFRSRWQHFRCRQFRLSISHELVPGKSQETYTPDQVHVITSFLLLKFNHFPVKAIQVSFLHFFFLFYIHTCNRRKQQLTVVGNIYGHFESVPARICCKFSLLLLPSVVLQCWDVNFLADSSLILNYVWLPPEDIHSLEQLAKGVFFTKAALRMF